MDEEKGDIFIRNEEKESLSSLLNFHHTKIMDKIYALKFINRLSSGGIIEDYLDLEKVKFFQKANSQLNADEQWEYKFEASLETLAPTGHFKFKHPKVHKIHGEETRMYNNRENIKRASKEMVIVYLVVIFEEFLSNVLIALFSKRRETLRNSDKQIFFKDAVEYTGIYELVKDMSKKEAEGIIDLDIEELGKRLESRFHLCLNNRDDWIKFKELFYRRNIIVHNYGAPNAKYIEKTKNTEFEVKGDKNEWLEISDTYIIEAFSTFENYANEITHFFHQKYAHEKL